MQITNSHQPQAYQQNFGAIGFNMNAHKALRQRASMRDIEEIGKFVTAQKDNKNVDIVCFIPVVKNQKN